MTRRRWVFSAAALFCACLVVVVHGATVQQRVVQDGGSSLLPWDEEQRLRSVAQELLTTQRRTVEAVPARMRVAGVNQQSVGRQLDGLMETFAADHQQTLAAVAGSTHDLIHLAGEVMAVPRSRVPSLGAALAYRAAQTPSTADQDLWAQCEYTIVHFTRDFARAEAMTVLRSLQEAHERAFPQQDSSFVTEFEYIPDRAVGAWAHPRVVQMWSEALLGAQADNTATALLVDFVDCLRVQHKTVRTLMNASPERWANALVSRIGQHLATHLTSPNAPVLAVDAHPVTDVVRAMAQESTNLWRFLSVGDWARTYGGQSTISVPLRVQLARPLVHHVQRTYAAIEAVSRALAGVNLAPTELSGVRVSVDAIDLWPASMNAPEVVVGRVQVTLAADASQDTVNAVSMHDVLTALARQQIAPVLSRVASVGVVLRASIPNAKRRRNDAATWILETGQTDKRPYFDKGLTGVGEIVAVGDSGADHSNCLLHDFDGHTPSDCATGCRFKDTFVEETCYNEYLANTSTPCERQPLNCDFSGASCTTLSQHRKIPMYWGFVDMEDEVDGHGTHVTGSVAGQPLNFSTDADSISRFHGSGMGARVVFTDLGSVLNDRAIFPPDDVYHDYFPQPYQLGAKIHTNSWGGWDPDTGTQYEEIARDIDRFTHEHRDFLVLFAAGNEGDVDWSSVGNEAAMKNGISVGASRTNADHFLTEVVDFTVWPAYRTIAPKMCDFGGFWNLSVVGTNRSVCQEFVVSGPWNNCTQVQSYFCNGFTQQKTAFCCQADSHDIFRGFFGNGCCDTRIRAAFQDQQTAGYLDLWSPAYFSSRGPTADQRVKPDIMSPGDVILSTRSDNDPATTQCSPQASDPDPAILRMSGTSMATPHLAGTSARVRQYYHEGWYACGTPPCAENHNPSSALVKATLVSSAVPMFGHAFADQLTQSVRPLSRTKSDQFVTGHGLTRLSSALQFAGLTNITTQLKFFDFVDALGVGQGDVWTTSFTIPAELAGADFAMSVALVWTDPAAAVSANVQLVSDLDLEVVTPSCEFHTGNEYLRLFDVHAAGTYQIDAYTKEHGRAYDRRNNVERVFINSPQAGEYTVNVYGRSVPTVERQGYAVVINYGVPKQSLPLSQEQQSQPSQPQQQQQQPQQQQRVHAAVACPAPEYVTPSSKNEYSLISMRTTQQPGRNWNRDVDAQAVLTTLANALQVEAARFTVKNNDVIDSVLWLEYVVQAVPPKTSAQPANQRQPSSSSLAATIGAMVQQGDNKALAGNEITALLDPSFFESVTVTVSKSGGGGGGLSNAAKVGIALGVIAAVALIAGCLYYRWKADKTQQDRFFMSMGDDLMEDDMSSNYMSHDETGAFEYS